MQLDTCILLQTVRKVPFFMHFQNSCTRNRDHHVPLIMAGNTHKAFCHKLWLTLKVEGIEIETQSKLMIATKWWLLS